MFLQENFINLPDVKADGPTCLQCNKGFRMSQQGHPAMIQYKIHVMTHHRGIEPPVNYDLAAKARLLSRKTGVNITAVPASKKLLCTVCHKGFTNSTGLGGHMRQIHQQVKQNYLCVPPNNTTFYTIHLGDLKSIRIVG